MLVDGKYHIASLVAVFMALGLGIVIGASAFRDDTLVRRQELMISRLEQEFNALKAERESLQQKVTVLEQESSGHAEFTSAVKQFLVEDQLLNRRIAIVSCATQLDETIQQGTEELLQRAGAVLTGVWLVSSDWLAKDWIHLSEAKELVASMGWSADAMDTALALGLAQQIAASPDDDLVRQMEKLGVVKTSNLNGQGADTVLLFSVQDSVPGIHSALVDAFLALDLLVAVVPSREFDSVPPEIREREIIMVDSINRDLGQIALVQALAHRRSGRFTSMPSSQILPDRSASANEGLSVPVVRNKDSDENGHSYHKCINPSL